MVHGMYAVRDRAADAFIPPFFLPTDGMAIREFLQAAKDQNSKFFQHPTDFSLYKLGSFDDSNGMVRPLVEPLYLVNAEGMVSSSSNGGH